MSFTLQGSLADLGISPQLDAKQRFNLAAVFAQHPHDTVSLMASVAASDIEHIARYDILLALPGATLDFHLQTDGIPTLTGPHSETGDFLTALQQWQLAEGTAPQSTNFLPFNTGWFVYASYELAGLIEPSLNLWQSLANSTNGNDVRLIASAMRCHGSIIWDHQTQQLSLQADTEVQLHQLKALLRQTKWTPASDLVSNKMGYQPALLAEDGNRFKQAVNRIKQYIVDGDVFQVNLSRGWQLNTSSPVDALDLYHALCEHNPAPFAAIARVGNDTIISSSPERLVRGNHEVLETRPIAGTRPRGASEQQDNDLQVELIQHPKERAEHIMLIDLERNDLGRVCVPGSINVNELMTIESYAHVHHIVSNVRGTPKPGLTFAEALAAVFPGGTITGCPKVRCMQIINELEQTPRGAYTGMLGYLDLDGRFDSNILIRTLSLKNNKQTVEFRAGAGIVADSDPEHELAETTAKARGMLLALQAVFGATIEVASI